MKCVNLECKCKLTFMVVVADVADYKAMWLVLCGGDVIYQGGDTGECHCSPLLPRQMLEMIPPITTQALLHCPLVKPVSNVITSPAAVQVILRNLVISIL